MSYKVLIDSCGELTEKMKKDGHFQSIPLTISVDDYHIVDDETFDQADFLRRVAASPNCPKSACPSPQLYMDAFDCDADHVYAVTLSAELSGSYSSAVNGMNMYKEEHPDAKAYVFNSRSASIGETLIGMKIQECEEAGMSFEEVIETVEAYIAKQNTWFILESLEALRKNGRLSTMKAIIATALNIKPVMTATPIGTIEKLSQARGMNKAMVQMVEAIQETVGDDDKNRILAISHCNCIKRAELVRDELNKRMHLKDIVIVDTAGVSSLYASDGGIIVVA